MTGLERYKDFLCSYDMYQPHYIDQNCNKDIAAFVPLSSLQVGKYIPSSKQIDINQCSQNERIDSHGLISRHIAETDKMLSSEFIKNL